MLKTESIILVLARIILPILSILAIFFLIVRRKKLFKNPYREIIWVSALIFFSIYVLYNAIAFGSEIYYDWNLNSYDLNNDGSFSMEESTAEQKLALEKVVNDTARNFAFIVGAVYSIIISGIVLIAGLMGTFIKLKTKKTKASLNNKRN